MRKTVALSGLVLLFLVSTTQAADVKVKGAHLCCGQCVKAVGKALGNVKGVSGAKCDRNAKTITFDAANPKAAKAGINALAKAGFFGKATVGGKKASFPPSGAKKGQKADKVVLQSVHLCCGGCIKAVGKATKNVKGADSVKCDRKKSTVTLTGEGISVEQAVAALNKAGFYARVGKKK